MMRRTAWLAALGTSVSVSVSAIARQDEHPPQVEMQTLFVAERSAIGDFLVSEKDEALKQALGMLPARLRELREQSPGLAGIPTEALDLFEFLAARPGRIAIVNKGFDPRTGVPRFGAVMSCVAASEDEARVIHGHVEALRARANMPLMPGESKRFSGMTDLPLPVGVLSYGPRKSADGWRYELILGAVDDPDGLFGALPAVEKEVKPVFRGSIDLAAWSPMVQMLAGFAAMMSPEGRRVIEEFRSLGLLGPDAIKVDCVVGYAADSCRETWRVRGAGKFMEAWGLTKESISAEDLSAIPADASFVCVIKVDFTAQWAGMKQQLEAAAGDRLREMLDEARAGIGIDLESDVIAALGTTAAAYIADSTGGGSLLSMVVLVSAADPALLAAVLDKCAAHANEFLKDSVPPPAAVEAASFERDGVRWVQLRFPGLPVPLEPTIAVVGNWLVAGATPQAAVSAAKQIRAGGPGLAASKAFAAGRWNPPDGARPGMICFIDAGRTIRDGYPSLSLLTSALSNAVRTRGGSPSPRDPGLILPLYPDLVAGSRPTVGMTWWAGDDVVMEWRCDRSMLANLAAYLGVGDAVPFIGGFISGLATGTYTTNRESGPAIRGRPAREYETGEDHEEDGSSPARERGREREKVPY